jgi:hypothetical protein
VVFSSTDSLFLINFCSFQSLFLYGIPIFQICQQYQGQNSISLWYLSLNSFPFQLHWLFKAFQLLFFHCISFIFGPTKCTGKQQCEHCVSTCTQNSTNIYNGTQWCGYLSLLLSAPPQLVASLLSVPSVPSRSIILMFQEELLGCKKYLQEFILNL